MKRRLIKLHILFFVALNLNKTFGYFCTNNCMQYLTVKKLTKISLKKSKSEYNRFKYSCFAKITQRLNMHTIILSYCLHNILRFYNLGLFLILTINSVSILIRNINSFSTNVPLLYPLKTESFPDFFRGYRSEALVENGLNK